MFFRLANHLSKTAKLHDSIDKTAEQVEVLGVSVYMFVRLNVGEFNVGGQMNAPERVGFQNRLRTPGWAIKQNSRSSRLFDDLTCSARFVHQPAHACSRDSVLLR